MTEAEPAHPRSATKAGIRSRNQDLILSAAIRLFARKGFDGVRVGEIAAACGLPRANVYYYYPSKQKIYAAAIELVLSGWDQAFEEISSRRQPAEAIEAYIRAKLEYSLSNPDYSRVFAGEMLRGGRFLEQRHLEHIRQVTRERAAVIDEWIRQGRITPVNPYHFFITLWSSTQYYADYHGFVSALLERPLSREVISEAAMTITRVVLGGCCQEGSPKDPPVPASPGAASLTGGQLR